jgi:16S rRNA (adenine1518-N6/adenine1519-N6)-dimethyltransferase
MKKLGQHFLKNKSVLDTIITVLDLQKGDRVIEIGPGHGELTVPLLVACEKLECAVTSIEKDRSLIAELMVLQEKEGIEKFNIIEGDALTMLPEIIAEVSEISTGSAKKTTSYKIVGNIPYYITGKLLRVISELKQKPETTVIMIQKEVAERICAAPPEMNRLAASVQFWADAKIIASVPKKDFTPMPEVDSAVILLTTKKVSTNEEQYYSAVRGIFAQPRKNLINNIFEMSGKQLAKIEIAENLKKIGIDPEGRPQNLSIEEIIVISQEFSQIS